MKFIRDADYKGKIKAEIMALITGGSNDSEPTNEQINAEETAISTITEYIGGRYDCNAIFQPWDGTGPDFRNKHVVKITIDLALYELYGQVGTRDVPEHRQVKYDNAISWLKDVGRGNVASSLPPRNIENGGTSEIRFNSRPAKNHKY